MSASKEFNKVRAGFVKRARAADVPDKAFKLAHLIAYEYMDSDVEETIPIKQERLALDVKASERTVRSLLRILQSLGLNIATGNGRGNASIYRIDAAEETVQRRKSTSAFDDHKGGNHRPERRKPETPKGGNQSTVKAEAAAPHPI
jgi:hypothetical protein